MVESFWVLLSIHILMFLEIIYFRIFFRKRSNKVQIRTSKQFNLDTTSTVIIHSSLNPYMKFPKFSWAVFCKCLKLNHIVLRIFLREFTFVDRALEIVGNNILLIGIFGITGSQLKAWSNVNPLPAGLLAAALSRIFHWWYSSLQVKQQKIPNEFSSNKKFIMEVEEEVIKRLNTHRIMRRILGYFIMVLYYGVNLYYCVQFLLHFSSEQSSTWTIAFTIAVILEYFFIEFAIVFVKIQAVNYLKIGGSQLLEALSKLVINDEFLKTFN